jgi:hypothetical protein
LVPGTMTENYWIRCEKFNTATPPKCIEWNPYYTNSLYVLKD